MPGGGAPRTMTGAPGLAGGSACPTNAQGAEEECPHDWGHGSLKGYATVLRRSAPQESSRPMRLQNRDVHLIVIGVQGLDGQRQVAGCFEELRQGHVELVQARESGGESLEEDRRLLAANVDYQIGIRGVERATGARRTVGHRGC